MKKLIVFFLVLACGRAPHKIDIPTVNCDMKGCEEPVPPKMPKSYPVELRPHIESFENDSKLQGVTVHDTEGIEFQNGVLEDNPNVLGVCYRAGERRWIRISSEWWVKMTEIYRRQLIYHELGHCGLSRPHLDAKFTIDFESYESIMSTYVTFGQDEEVEKNWPILVNELFHPDDYADTQLHEHSVLDECHVTPEGYEACPITYGKAFR